VQLGPEQGRVFPVPFDPAHDRRPAIATAPRRFLPADRREMLRMGGAEFAAAAASSAMTAAWFMFRP
jgi:hypothetical protein